MNYEEMSLEELEEAYEIKLSEMKGNDGALFNAANELARLTDTAQKGSMLLVQQAIRWERVAKLLDDVEKQMRANESLLEDLRTINYYYNEAGGGG